MTTEAEYEAAQQTLAYIERTKQKLVAIVTADLSKYIAGFDNGMACLSEAYDEMVYDEVKEASVLIREFESEASRRHHHQESTRFAARA